MHLSEAVAPLRIYARPKEGCNFLLFQLKKILQFILVLQEHQNSFAAADNGS
jgi:hypothetical protein